MNHVTIPSLVLPLLFAVFVTSIEAETSSINVYRRPWRVGGGWSLNSIGYNGGLSAMRKYLQRRSGGDATAESPFEAGQDVGNDAKSDDYTALVDEFYEFLTLKDAGLLKEDVLQCIVQRLGAPPAE